MSTAGEISIIPYSADHSDDALAVEALCPQGDSLTLRYVRPTFHRRSEAFSDAQIFSAMHNGRVIGVSAAALKEMTVHGERKRVTYGYDLRVHPEYRKFGTAKRLTRAVMEAFGGVDCNYTYVAVQNSRALAHFQRGMGARVAIPLTYLILPVYKPMMVANEFNEVSMEELHSQYLAHTPGLDFAPALKPENMIGHVRSITDGERAGVSIWTYEDILAEQVLAVPKKYRVMGVAQKVLSPFVRMPHIPSVGETLKSWFLYDLFAANELELKHVLAAANAMALTAGKDFLYVLLQDNDPLAWMIKRTGIRHFTMPYNLLANGEYVPEVGERLYVDVRDL